MANAASGQSGQRPEPSFGKLLRDLRAPLLITGALPVLIYVLVGPHVAALLALGCAGAPPLGYSVYGWIQRRGIDLISAITLFTVVVSMALAALVHNQHLLLIRDSFLTEALLRRGSQLRRCNA